MRLDPGLHVRLAGLKAYLEHGVELNLVADQVPDGHVEGWEDVRDDE
ncbi:MAG: hypothetical protein R2849_10805 [Thermomicrobiales bacterium]